MTGLRPLRPGDDSAILRIHRETFALGKPLPEFPDFEHYENLTLSWYLGEERGNAAVVVDDDDEVVGYVLVCTAHDDFARWQRGAALRFFRQVAPKLLLGTYPDDARDFYRNRLRDGYEAWRSGFRPEGVEAHVHFNLVRRARRSLTIKALLGHADAVVAAAGFDRWLGEMNAVAGQRERVLTGHGHEVVHRQPNRTLSALAGKSVTRLTVVRPVGAFDRTVGESAA